MATLSSVGGPRGADCTPAGAAFALAARLAPGARAVQPYDHDGLVRELAEVLLIGGFGAIQACAGPYPRPAPVPLDEASLIDPDEQEAYVPDVATVSRHGKLDLFACDVGEDGLEEGREELAGAMSAPHTLSKALTARAWSAFARRARRHGRGSFWVVVREPLGEAARLRLIELRLQGRVLTL